MNFIDITIYYAVHTTVYVYLLLFIKLLLPFKVSTVYVYLLLFIKLSLSKINAIKLLTRLLLKV
jgi:hypothetical protein